MRLIELIIFCRYMVTEYAGGKFIGRMNSALHQVRIYSSSSVSQSAL